MTLVFGCRQPELDHIYREEIEDMKRKGVLRDIYTAYSRLPGQEKVRLVPCSFRVNSSKMRAGTDGALRATMDSGEPAAKAAFEKPGVLMFLCFPGLCPGHPAEAAGGPCVRGAARAAGPRVRVRGRAHGAGRGAGTAGTAGPGPAPQPAAGRGVLPAAQGSSVTAQPLHPPQAGSAAVPGGQSSEGAAWCPGAASTASAHWGSQRGSAALHLQGVLGISFAGCWEHQELQALLHHPELLLFKNLLLPELVLVQLCLGLRELPFTGTNKSLQSQNQCYKCKRAFSY